MIEIVNMERKIDVEKKTELFCGPKNSLTSEHCEYDATHLGSSEISETLYDSHQLSRIL